MTADPTRPPTPPEGPSLFVDRDPRAGRDVLFDRGPDRSPEPGTDASPTDPSGGAIPGGPPWGRSPDGEPDVEDILYADRYVLGPLLGRGGTCSVYRAWDTRLQRHVAIKRLEPPLSDDEHARARFNREGKAIARLSHPHLVTLIDRGTTDTEEYLVFQYVQGRSLKDVIRATGPMDPADVGRIVGQVAEGLAYAHSLGIVHRDVKPQNILLDAEGRAKLTDFGIATGVDLTKVTREGSIVGSSRYMSPEQVQGRPVDARSDVYSLGIVMYEMLTGVPPFQGTSIVEVGRQHVRERPAPLRQIEPDVPENVERVVLRCLEKLPESRFQSMDELLGALVGVGLYEPEPVGGGLLDTLRRGARSLGGDHEPDWVPPPGTEAPPPDLPPEVLQRAAASSGARTGDQDAERLRRADIMRHRKRKSATGRWQQIALALGLVVIVVIVVLFVTGGKTAPDLVGRTLDEARTLAADAGLQLEVDPEQVLRPDRPEGTVLSQDPVAGAETDGDTVRVVVTREPIAVTVTELDDYDPQGDDEERPDLLPQLIDGETGTGWSTESYRSADFGGLGKAGVGVDFVLDSPATLLEIVSPSSGWTGQILVGTPGSEGLTPVADLTGGETQSVDLGSPVTRGRVWITSLSPGEDGRFLVQLAELRFFR